MGSCSENEEKSATVETAVRGDEPLQLIEFIKNDNDGNTTIKLREDTISQISNKAGNRPLAIICICGPSRQGKSFMLGHMIRCLEALEKEETDWMEWENKEKPLKGFKFRNGAKPETQGIWVWSKSFIVKNDEDQEVAVLLIDTQGTCDEFTTTKDMSAILGLSLLTSSVMIFNCFTNLQEDILSSLNTYTHYGQLALDNVKDNTPFQKLVFLIRDWNNPGEYAYGSKGGKKFLEEKLKIKDDQPPEARQVRDTIKKCFQDLDCFLMPSIGEKALYPDFNGAIGGLAPNFAKKMEEFISNLISSETLTIKQILGDAVTAAELRPFLDNYLEVFNSSEIPSAKSMWEATSDVHNSHMVRKACSKFSELVKKKMRGNNYLLPDVLEKAQTAAEKQALELFKKARKFGSPEKIAEYEEQLENNLKKDMVEMKKQNEEKRHKYIAAVINDAMTQFLTSLEDAIPFDDDDPLMFYEDNIINREAVQAKAAVITDLKEKIENETEETITKKVQSLEAIMESTLTSHMNRNKAQRAEAEKKMMEIVEEKITKFEEEIKDFLNDNEFAEDSQLEQAQENLKTIILEAWNEAKKPDKKEFHKEFYIKLEKELVNVFSKLENEHKLKMQQYQMESEKWILETREAYEQTLTKFAEKIELEEELEQFHEGCAQNILENFAEGGNPYPTSHYLNAKLVEKLKDHLDNIFERVKREIVQSQQRCEESYREAVFEGVQYYEKEMNEILTSSEFMADKDLEVEHERAMVDALDIYENFEKLGFPDNALNFKVDLQQALQAKYFSIKERNDQRRELAHSRAKNCVNECHSKYEEVMKSEMNKVRTVKEMETLHAQATTEALEMFHTICPAKEDPEFVGPYEQELNGEIEDTFEELKDLLEMRQNEESVAVKGILQDCRKYYHDEMSKHCKNTSFIRPEQLESYHKQASHVVIERCAKLIPLSSFQRMDLEQEMESLYLKYVNENDMKLNSGAGIAPAIGIDLGTTYCCVAVFFNGRVIIIPNQEQGNSETTASYVTFNSDGSKTIGDVAKENAFENPENTIYDAKRILGRRMSDPELQRDMTFWPFEVVEDQEIPKIKVNGKLFYPEQVSCELLSECRVMVEKFLGLDPGTITKAVITVPAYFNDGQRQATIDAGELAGLEVLTILNEPTAAAIAYSLERLDNSARKVLIFDLGGGTFDVAVLDITPGNIKVLGVAGDTHLGGEDFDQKMMEYCALTFKANEGIDLLDGKDSSNKKDRDEARRRMRRLQTYCEKAKKFLSSGRTITVSIDAMYEGLDLKVDISRDKFEELNEPQFKKAIEIVEKALCDTHIRKEEIEDVVLVGGSTRIPKVREMLTDYFGGKALNFSINADQAVAYGAAVKAAMMNGEQAKGEIDFDSIDDVTPLSLGIAVLDKDDRKGPRLFSVIIPKNTTVPKRMKEVYFTSADNQKNCDIKIYQGEEYIAANNELLGNFLLEGIPPAKAGKESLDVWMEIDSMGILHVEAVCKSTKGSNKITVTAYKQRMSKETKSRILAEANPA